MDDVQEAREALAFSEDARRRARRDLGRPWVPLVLLGSFSVASLSLTDAAISPTALFWAFIGPIGAGAIALYAYRRSKTVGLEGSPLAYVAITVGLLILAYAAGKAAFAFQIPALGRMGPPLVVAAGYLVLGWVERSRTVVGVALALIGATLASVALDLSSVQSNTILFALYGLTLLAIGFGMRVNPARPA